MNKSFWIGVAVGVGSLWAYHAFIKPMPGKSNG